MELVLSITFWLTLFLCAATYFGYPLTIWALARIFPCRVRRWEGTPTVSVIVSAYNEERHLRQKIANTLAMDYPKDRLEVIVGSDGSTDRTAAIASEFENRGVRVLAFETNRGKTAVQNDCVAVSRGEILVFTDAASFLRPDALRFLVRNFADGRVGCVAGRLRFVNTEHNLTTQSQGLYWRYEVMIRELESDLGRVIGVDGPLYAVRREDYVPLASQVISDLMTPLLVLGSGKRVILEPEAVVDEEPTEHGGQELRTRRRITLRALVGLAAHAELLNPLKHPALAAQLFFHKVVRWFVGPLVLVNAICALLLAGSPFFRAAVLGYGLFLAVAAAGFLADRLGVRSRGLTVPYYFTLVNAAAVLGIIDFLRGRQAVSWRPIREHR